MPWTIDALLPIEQRYTSPRFRQFARFFVAGRYDYADSAELTAFVHVIGVEHAKWIWKWRGKALDEVNKLMDHMRQFDDVQQMIRDNLDHMDNEDGLKCLRAMQDGGFTRGSVPNLVRMALLDMRDQGISQKKIGERLGLTHDQVRVMANGPRKTAPRGLPPSALVAGGPF